MNNTKRNKYLGRGEENKTSLFKPLVAASLALALGVSVASATATCGSGTPSICLGSETTDSSNIIGSNKSFEITWNDSSDGSSNIYEMTTTALTANGNFAFYLEGSTQNNGGVSVVNSGGYKAQIDNSITSLTISGNGKSIKMGSSRNGTLSIGGGNGKTITLDLSNLATSTNYALDGNLLVGSWESGVVNATLGGQGVSGGIIIQGGVNALTFSGSANIGGEVKVKDGTNTFTFKENAQTGRFWIHKGSNTITFEKNATISSGNEAIYSGKSYNTGGNDTGAQTFRFKGDTNSITGTGGAAISVAGGSVSNSTNSYNKLYFENGNNTIKGKIAATTNANVATDPKSGYGLNHIEFNSNTQTNTITGNIETAMLGQNEIIFGGSVQNKIVGDLVASGNGNTITFNGTGSHSIIGQILASNGQNTIDVTQGTDTTIDASGTESGIKSSKQSNQITIASSGKNIIKGNITAQGMEYQSGPNAEGTNTITFSNARATNSITGDVTASNYNSAVATNNISFGGAKNTISGTISNTKTPKYSGGNNNITFIAGSVSSISGEIKTAGGTNTIIFGYTPPAQGSKDVIYTLAGVTPTSSISANIIASEGTNNITFNSGSGDSSITGNITATGGTNTITLLGSSNTIVGNLSNNAGTNTIDARSNALTLGSQTNKVTILTNGGVNATTSITAGSLTAYIDSMTAGNHANGAKTNTISGGANSNLTIGTMSATQNANSYNAISVGEGSSILVTGNITSSTGKNNFTFTGDSSSLTLKGTTSQISTLTAVSGNATNKDALNIDTSTNTNSTSIDKIVNGENLIVNMKGGATYSATLTLNNTSANSTIKTLNLTEASSSADKNILNLQARTTTILNEVNIASGKGLTINLNGTSTLEPDNGFSNSGNAKINFNGSNGVFDSVIDTSGSGAITTINIANNQVGTITGDIAQDNGGANNVEFKGGTAKLTLQGYSNTLNSVTANTSGILSLDGAGSQSGVQANITTLMGSNLTANFNGNQNKEAKLILNGSSATLARVTLEANSTNNTLNLTSLTSATISSAVSVASTQGLTIALGSTNMTFAQGLSGNSVLSVSGASSFTTTTGDMGANSLNLVGDGSAKATFKNATTTLSTLNANAKGGNTLALDATNNGVAVTLNNAFNGVLSVELNGSASNSATLTLNGGTIQGIKATEGNDNKVIFSSGNNTINNAIDSTSVANGKTLSLQVGNSATLYSRGNLNNDNGGTLNLTLTDSTLSLGGENNKISSLVASGKTLVDLARVDSEGNALTRAVRTMKTLEIGANSGSGFKGDATFEVYVGGGQADKVIFSAVEQNNGKVSNVTLVASGGLYGVLNGGGTLLASVADSEKNDIVISGGERLIGGVVVKTELESKEENGKTKYYLKQGEDLGAPIQYQEVASSALTVNYDLYLANFNSLNKRMGELRDDANSNGVWARVFGGAMSNDFGSGSKTEYITAQAGYDYALSVGNNARNHLGIAVAYGTSNTQGNTLSMNGLLGASGSISLNEVDSHMVEVGIYNTFISDSGWYNDTIFKFDYIMSKFSLSNKTDLFTDTSNFAIVLSDEFGYRYKFGENEKGNWYIDPQLEVAFGYFNQSDFNRAMYDTAGLYQSTMRATQANILTLRTRAGASLGKKFNTEKGFVTLYVGAFYEYDYINGGNASIQGRIGGTTVSLDSLESNGRAMLNIGSNIEPTKGARLYIDVEKSFGDKQRTFMQFNLGARCSF